MMIWYRHPSNWVTPIIPRVKWRYVGPRFCDEFDVGVMWPGVVVATTRQRQEWQLTDGCWLLYGPVAPGSGVGHDFVALVELGSGTARWFVFVVAVVECIVPSDWIVPGPSVVTVARVPGIINSVVLRSSFPTTTITAIHYYYGYCYFDCDPSLSGWLRYPRGWRLLDDEDDWVTHRCWRTVLTWRVRWVS